MRTTVIHDVGELVGAISERQDRNLGQLWFRGHQDANWQVAPSLWRSEYTHADERNFTHRFRTRAAIRRPSTPEYGDHAGWLSLMQHYGLPTRLLDWSRSPLVAAYFAMERYLPQDGIARPISAAAIWVLSPHRLNELRGIHVTPSISSGECAGLVGAAFRDVQDDRSLRQRADGVLAAMASETDLRMFVQQGCFTVHSSDAGILEDQPDSDYFLEKLVIPLHAVQRFARQVELCGFRPGDIYPDLEHLATELRWEFPPGSVRGMKGGF